MSFKFLLMGKAEKLGLKHFKSMMFLKFPQSLYKLLGLMLSFQRLTSLYFQWLTASFPHLPPFLRVKRDFNKRQANLAFEQTKDPQEENGQNNNLWVINIFFLGHFLPLRPASSDFHSRMGRLHTAHTLENVNAYLWGRQRETMRSSLTPGNWLHH